MTPPTRYDASDRMNGTPQLQFKRGDQPGDSIAHNGDIAHAPRW